MSYSIRQNDTYPPLYGSVFNSSGTVHLGDVTRVNFVARDASNVTRIDSAATVADPAAGLIKYSWGVSDTSRAGTLYGQFRVYAPSTGTFSVPTSGFFGIPINSNDVVLSAESRDWSSY